MLSNFFCRVTFLDFLKRVSTIRKMHPECLRAPFFYNFDELKNLNLLKSSVQYWATAFISPEVSHLVFVHVVSKREKCIFKPKVPHISMNLAMRPFKEGKV